MLYISDVELTEIAKQIPALAQAIEDGVAQYCDILDSIEGEGILEGATARQVTQYSTLVQGTLAGKATTILEDCSTDLTAFSQAVAGEDETNF